MIAQSASGPFFVDRSLGGRRIVEALRQSGASAIAHDEEFPIDATDEEWLEEAGRRRWLVLTKDSRIARRTLELLAIARAEARVFVLGAGNMTSAEMSAILVRASGSIATSRHIGARSLHREGTAERQGQALDATGSIAALDQTIRA